MVERLLVVCIDIIIAARSSLHHRVEILRSGRHRSSLIRRFFRLDFLPLIDALGNVDADTRRAELLTADVAHDGLWSFGEMHLSLGTNKILLP